MYNMLIIYTLGLLCAVLAIALIWALRAINRRQNSLRASQDENIRLNERIAVMAERDSSDRERDGDRLKALAAETLAAGSHLLTDQSKSQIAELLAPIKENLDSFRRSYTDAYGKESEKRAMLEQQLNELFRLNRHIGDEARRLGDALRGNSKVQGQWGEMVLENILDRSGLVRGTDYLVQHTVGSPDGRLRPDIVIKCPGNRNIVVDSKVSLSDYMRMTDASDSAVISTAGAAHVASVRKHVTELRRKNYQDLLDGRNPDFVMMFIPHEGAYLAAMQLDSQLWQTAFDSRVIIVSPTHLISVVRLVEMLWRQEKQSRNAVEIADLGAKMLDKLSNFIGDMEKLRNGIDAASRAYDSAITRLEGRGGLRSIGEKMAEKGIKGSRQLPAD